MHCVWFPGSVTHGIGEGEPERDNVCVLVEQTVGCPRAGKHLCRSRSGKRRNRSKGWTCRGPWVTLPEKCSSPKPLSSPEVLPSCSSNLNPSSLGHETLLALRLIGLTSAMVYGAGEGCSRGEV